MEPTQPQFDAAQFLDVVRRRRLWIFLTPLVCLVGAYFYSSQQTELYRASSVVRVESDQIATEVELVTASATTNAVAETIGPRFANISSVNASLIGETQLVNIQVQAEDPDLAAEAANEWALTFSQVRNAELTDSLSQQKTALVLAANELSDDIVAVQGQINALEAGEPGADQQLQLAELNSQLVGLRSQQQDLLDRANDIDTELITLGRTIQVTDPATVPKSPFQPKPIRDSLAGLFAGLVLGGVAAAVAELVDDRIWSPTDMQRWAGDLPIIASIPKLPKADAQLPIALEDPTHPASEGYRVLRTALQFLSIDHPVQRLVITSASLGDGKTTTAANLAVTMARGGSRVVLMDADLRRSRVHVAFGVNPAVGVTNAIIGEASVADALVPVRGLEPGSLELLPAGPTPPNPAELIGSEATRAMLHVLRQDHDRIVVDTAPVLAASDTMAMSQHVDGVLLVARVRRTRGREFARAVARLRQSNVPLLGIVFNGDPTKETAYIYGPARSAKESRRRSKSAA